jgi:hypothetical protein
VLRWLATENTSAVGGFANGGDLENNFHQSVSPKASKGHRLTILISIPTSVGGVCVLQLLFSVIPVFAMQAIHISGLQAERSFVE